MLKIDWALGYGNLPHIILEEEMGIIAREECEFTFKDGIWYHIQDNGLVHYYAHSGKDINEGGYGGANITIMHNGEPKILKGPWSSRASCVSMVAGEPIADIRLITNARWPHYMGILVSELVKRWDQEAYLLRGKPREEGAEPGAVTVSLANNCILKPDNSRYDPATDYEVFAEPVK